MIEHLDFIVIDAQDAMLGFLVLGVSELDNPDIILNLNFFDVVDVPPGFALVNKVFDDFFVGSLFIEVLDIDEHGEPSGISLALGVGGEEVFSFDKETSILADVNDHIELVFSVGGKEVVFRLVDESDVSAVLVEGGVGSGDLVVSEVGELGEDVSVGVSEGLV
jgi:hypothetical protein